MKFELGVKVKDTQSPFKGTVVARHEYLEGSPRYTVKSSDLAPSSGRIVEEFLNEGNLVVDEAAPADATAPTAPTA